MNPNKEARIRKLEIELEQTKEHIKTLEERVNVLEDVNENLNSRIDELAI
ncbi:MAG: hypothetical protein HKO89_00440 [Saprospiraceae bacterium]|nr:hypothetical protein [Bacteroidia bacterium]NNK89052.1 hypothetical protein [Saprospiraceae bacterium]